MANKLDTKSLFKVHYICWRILGMYPTKSYRPLFWTYSLVVNILLIVCYPLHLMIGLISSVTMYEVLQNLSINITSVVCVFKSYAVWWQFKKVDEIFTIVRRQDERLEQSPKEREYLEKVVYPPAQFIIKLFYVLCTAVFSTASLSVLVNTLLGKWGLMYKAYFPFDVFATTTNYAAASIYQSFGLIFICLQQFVNDTFAPSHLALLAGRVHMLGMRVAKLGHDPKKTKEANNQELLQCISDHKELLQYHKTLENVISVYMFFQILLASINMCFVLVFTVLFVKDPFTMAYFISLVIGMVCEILPSCYYGTVIEDEFQNLAYALFSCNWPDQNLVFKKNLRIFAESASRRIYITAWLFRINNNSLIIAYKNTYTLFAIVMNMK